MKRKLFLLATLFLLGLGASGCRGGKIHGPHIPGTHDNGKHKGWFKNPKNPHHPASTNPGKGHQKGGKKKGKIKKRNN